MITVYDWIEVESLIVEGGGSYVELNGIFKAGNKARLDSGMQVSQMAAFLSSSYLAAYAREAALAWGVPQKDLIKKTGRGKNTRTHVHPSIALLAAERLSPKFHVFMHKEFIEGRLHENRSGGAAEFRKLNAIINTLPDRVGKDNKGVFISVANRIRAKIIPDTSQTWGSATALQTERRLILEQFLIQAIRSKIITSFDDLKTYIDRFVFD